MCPGIFVAAGIEAVVGQIKRSRLSKRPVASRIKLYEEARREAERAWQRRLQEYWMRLGGVEFERELATLYRRLGYRVESTPSSGDQGIDLILRKGGKTTVVQCKSHKSPVGPAVARELFGSMVAFPGADKAILACTGGFTQGVYEFVRGKPIELISASDLAKMGETVKYSKPDTTNDPSLQRHLQQRVSRTRHRTGRAVHPICPTPGCGKKMVSRTGRYGSSWGCPGYPKCRGTREI